MEGGRGDEVMRGVPVRVQKSVRVQVGIPEKQQNLWHQHSHAYTQHQWQCTQVRSSPAASAALAVCMRCTRQGVTRRLGAGGGSRQ